MVKYFISLSIVFFLLFFFFFGGQEVQANINSCAGVPISGSNYEVTADCYFDYSVSIVNGIEGGNLIIKAGKTLTIQAGQTLVFNPGQRVSFETGATLYIGSGGRLSVAYVWLKDEDNNGFPATTTVASRDNLGDPWKKRGEFKDPYGNRLETWNLTSDIKYDHKDEEGFGNVYPGTNCGEGRLCDLNADDGTCVAQPGGTFASGCAACRVCNGNINDTCTQHPATNWAAGTYGCAAGTGDDRQRCYGGACRKCSTGGGKIANDGCSNCANQGGLACWRRTANGGVCSTFCQASYGDCVAADWNDYSSCTVAKRFVTCNSCSTSEASTRAPRIQQDSTYDWIYYCRTRASGTSQSCTGSGTSWIARLCVCHY